MVSLSRQGQTVCLECACDVAEASDWILDASLLRWEGPENWELAFITAHNVLVSYVMEKGHAAISHYHSEVNCILYPGAFFNHNHIQAFSGFLTSAEDILLC